MDRPGGMIMGASTPPVIDYRHPRRLRLGRFWAALVLTVVSGVVVGSAISYRFNSLLVFAGYSFGCSVAMGLLARPRQVAIALAACITISGTMTAIKLMRSGRTGASLDLYELIVGWIALFILSAVCAAAAIPLTMIRVQR
jgi:hypothetical protein